MKNLDIGFEPFGSDWFCLIVKRDITSAVFFSYDWVVNSIDKKSLVDGDVPIIYFLMIVYVPISPDRLLSFYILKRQNVWIVPFINIIAEYSWDFITKSAAQSCRKIRADLIQNRYPW